MKKILSFLIVLAATATAFAQYNTELLADPSFEASEGAWGNYYWNETDQTDRKVKLRTNDSLKTNYYVNGTQVLDGFYSIGFELNGGASGISGFANLTLNDARNSGNQTDPFNSNEGVTFTGIDNQNLSYNAGDEILGSINVWIDNWDTNSGSGIEVRLTVDSDTEAPFTAASSGRITSTGGGWQTIETSYVFLSAFSGKISFVVASDYNVAAGDTNLAWVDSASLQVIPEASSIFLAFGAVMVTGFGIFWRRR